MAGENLSLFVASYDDAASADADLQALKDAQVAEDFVVVGAVVATCDKDGKITVEEHRAASPVAGGTALGAAGGLVVGLFAPPLLAATAIGAGIGAVIGEVEKHHEEKQLGVELEEYLPAGSSAILVVADDTYADRIDHAPGEVEQEDHQGRRLRRLREAQQGTRGRREERDGPPRPPDRTRDQP